MMLCCVVTLLERISGSYSESVKDLNILKYAYVCVCHGKVDAF